MDVWVNGRIILRWNLNNRAGGGDGINVDHNRANWQDVVYTPITLGTYSAEHF
jgi:hypothetical protein